MRKGSDLTQEMDKEFWAWLLLHCAAGLCGVVLQYSRYIVKAVFYDIKSFIRRPKTCLE